MPRPATYCMFSIKYDITTFSSTGSRSLISTSFTNFFFSSIVKYATTTGKNNHLITQVHFRAPYKNNFINFFFKSEVYGVAAKKEQKVTNGIFFFECCLWTVSFTWMLYVFFYDKICFDYYMRKLINIPVGGYLSIPKGGLHYEVLK